ncbi:MAG: HNH endonuclease [Coriobacteriales bacterium]|jgi:5-methylcytosine-specific restriction endonuclease McrA|nr:HNH endonuclease [Coriobacteriales bacterium]
MTHNPRKANGSKYRRLRSQLLASEDRCCICGGPIDRSLKTPHPMSAEIEHLVPVSKGGAVYARANCGISHRICNQRKGNKILMVHEEKSNIKGEAIETSKEW